MLEVNARTGDKIRITIGNAAIVVDIGKRDNGGIIENAIDIVVEAESCEIGKVEETDDGKPMMKVFI